MKEFKRLKPLESTIKKLCILSRNLCAYPGCNNNLVNDKEILIGKICHIESPEPGGPRFNPNSNNEDNRKFENLIMMCPNHHDEIDIDIDTFTVEYLKEIKKNHESIKEQGKYVFTEEELKKIFEQYNKAYYQKNSISIIPKYDIKKLIGRKDMLKKLHKMLTDNKSAILMNGIGGIGKTTVALAYCNIEKYKQEYQNIVWVTLTQSLKESIINTFIDKDIDFKYNEKEDININFNHLLNTLRNITGNNLLVLDNANNDKEISENKQSLEDTNWKILITTRCLLDYEYTIKVDKLSEEDAVNVFLQYCKIEDIETLKKFLKHIDYHTLLTELLAKTLKRSPLLDINKLYEIIKNQDISAPRIKKEIPIGAHAEYRKAAKKEEELYTYLLSIFELEDMSDKENEYLRYFSILHSVEISIIDLYKFFGISDETDIEFENTLNSLVQKGWILENNKTYKMHQLIQIVIREKLKPDAENCKDIISSFIDLLNYEPQESPLSRKELIPFAESILNLIKNDDKGLAILFERTANIFDALSNYKKTLEYIKENLRINEKLLDANHPDLAISYDNIANTYSSLGNYEKALGYHKKSIAIFKKVFNTNHPHLVISYGNIALTYSSLGNYEKALKFNLKAINIGEKVLDQNHPALASFYENIAGIYSSLGNYEMALEYQKKDITISEKVLDSNHPFLATSYSNIAITYKDLGNYEKALEFNLKAINIGEKIFNPDHSFLASYYKSIALTYSSLGNYEKALEYQKKDITIREKVLASEHPELATSYNNIACIYNDLGNYEKALEFNFKAINIGIKVLNPDHSLLAIYFNSIASTYSSLGNYEKALEYQIKDIKIIEKIFDPEHPSLATSCNNIALTYQSLGNYEKALEYHKKSILIREKVFNPEHPDLATSYNNIAETYRILGNYEKALEYQEKSITIREKVFNPEHPVLASSYNNLAEIYRCLGNYEKALEYNKKDLIIIEKILDQDHPDLASSYNNIALTYQDLGNYEKALKYQEKSLAIFENVLDKDHPSLANSYHNIAGTYYAMKDFKNSKYYIDKAVKICKIALPKDHPDLKDSLEWQKIINDALNNQ